MNMVMVKGETIAIAIEMEIFMIYDAVKLIEKANKFKGVLFENQDQTDVKAPLTISFSLIFPSEEEANEFVESCLRV